MTSQRGMACSASLETPPRLPVELEDVGPARRIYLRHLYRLRDPWLCHRAGDDGLDPCRGELFLCGLGGDGLLAIGRHHAAERARQHSDLSGAAESTSGCAAGTRACDARSAAYGGSALAGCATWGFPPSLTAVLSA